MKNKLYLLFLLTTITTSTDSDSLTTISNVLQSLFFTEPSINETYLLPHNNFSIFLLNIKPLFFPSNTTINATSNDIVFEDMHITFKFSLQISHINDTNLYNIERSGLYATETISSITFHQEQDYTLNYKYNLTNSSFTLCQFDIPQYKLFKNCLHGKDEFIIEILNTNLFAYLDMIVSKYPLSEHEYNFRKLLDKMENEGECIINIKSIIKSLRFGSGRYVFDNKKAKMFENVIIPTWYTTGDGNEKYVVIEFGKVMFDSDTFELMKMSVNEEIVDINKNELRKAVYYCMYNYSKELKWNN